MRSKTIVFLLAIAVATTAWAGAGEKCSYDAQTCLNHMAKQGKAGWAGIDGEMAENGYTVTKVFADGPGKSAGFKVGDVLTKLNGTSKDDANFEQVYMEAMKPGNTVTFTLLRGKTEKSVKVKLAEMPEDAFATMLGRHMLMHAETETASGGQ
jgi:PDZ domain-containing secreted protein